MEIRSGMKQLSLFFCAFSLISTLSFSQNNTLEFHSYFERQTLKSYLDSDTADMMSLQLMSDRTIKNEDREAFKLKFDKLVAHFKDKKAGNVPEKYFLSNVFYKTHRKLLKRYTKLASLGETFQTGRYNCLSATTLYAMLYDALGVKLEIIETNHHIYLKLNADQGVILIESTDPINGFITDKKEIEQKLQDVTNSQTPSIARQSKGDDEYYQFSVLLNESINMKKLIGLQYYNQAVIEFNIGKMTTAVSLLEKATIFYNNNRFKEFGILLANKLHFDGQMNNQERSEYLNRIEDFARVEFIVASR